MESVFEWSAHVNVTRFGGAILHLFRATALTQTDIQRVDVFQAGAKVASLSPADLQFDSLTFATSRKRRSNSHNVVVHVIFTNRTNVSASDVAKRVSADMASGSTSIQIQVGALVVGASVSDVGYTNSGTSLIKLATDRSVVVTQPAVVHVQINSRAASIAAGCCFAIACVILLCTRWRHSKAPPPTVYATDSFMAVKF